MDTRKRELEVLLEFSRAANAATAVDEVLREIASAVRGGFGYDRVGIFLTDASDSRRMCGTIGTDENGRETPIPDDNWSTSLDTRWDAIYSGKADYIYTDNAARDSKLFLSSGKPVAHHVLVPLRTPQGMLGVIGVDNALSDRPIDEREAETLLAFARQAATALQNVRLIEELRNSEEHLRSLVTSLTETLYSVRIGQGTVIPSFYSPQLEALTGYTPAEALTIPDFWRSVTHLDDRSKVEQAKEELAKGCSLAFEYRIVNRNGEVRWILDTPVPVADASGRYTRVNGSILDITDRKHLENRLRRAQRMETVGTLAGGVAHNFNNYLHMIGLQVTESQECLSNDHPSAAWLRDAQDTLQLASGLAKQLMAFGNKTEGSRAELSLDDLIARTLALVQPSLGSTIRVDHRPDSDVSLVLVDPSDIEQTVINLCFNARDAMPEGGTITIRTQNVRVREHDRNRPPNIGPGEYVRLQVHDTGAGMDAAIQERIFEPFFTTKTMGRGTGLGLAVTYTIVADHGGWIDVESRPGRGTLFSVYLPTVHLPRAASTTQPAELPPFIVLIVDPIEREREQLARLLESLGVDVLTAEGVSDAMAVMWDAGERIDAVVCSLNLPPVDVTQLTNNVQEDDARTTLILTGERAQVRELSRNGRNSSLPVLSKPYAAEKVAEALGIASSRNGR